MRMPGPLPITDCQRCPSRATSELCSLDGNGASGFEQIRRSLTYLPGQFVFYEGHAALGLYILCTGRVKLTRSTPKGQRRVVGIVDPGQLIEKHTFQDGAVHQVTCESLDTSQVCVIDRYNYLALLEQHGELAIKVIKLLSHEMGISLAETDQFAFASARERIAGLLLELADRYGEKTQEGSRDSARG